MSARQILQQALSTSAASGGAIIFPTALIDLSHTGQSGRCAADRALEYYRNIEIFGARSTRDEHGYGGIIRSLNREPPWVESIKMEELDGISSVRKHQLRDLTEYAKDTNKETLVEQFCQYKLEQFEILYGIIKKFGISVPDNPPLPKDEIDEFKSLIALARQLGPELACELEKILFRKSDGDSLDLLVGAGAPDLLLWTQDGEDEFWFFSEVKAPGDYLRATQKDWLAQHRDVVRGHFLLTILA